MGTAGGELRSGANEVYQGSWHSKPCVMKLYREKLKSYEAYWPISRAEVEASLLVMLGSETRVHIPELYKYQPPDTVIMEVCPGDSIYDIIIREPDAMASPSRLMWENLFLFLSDLNRYTPGDLVRCVGEAFAEQHQIAEGMYRWKMQNDVNPPYPDLRCLCLGDVSVHNLLWDGQRLCVLDLECAHWGYGGYDIGQLLGMTEALYKKRKSPKIKHPENSKPAAKPSGGPGFWALRDMEKAFRTVIKDEKILANCEYWRERFREYYLRSEAVK